MAKAILSKRSEGSLPKGSVIKDVYQVEEKVGRGGFGEVYRCKDVRKNKYVAVKLISKPSVNPGSRYLNNEAKALKAVQGKNFFALYYAYGRAALCDYLVMELLGSNLKNLKKIQPGKKFSVDTTLSMGRMMLKSIESLHNAGFLHRDIKPSNFAIGLEEKAQTVYLIDFGLSKQYISDNGELCALRNKVSFRGTSRYASANVLHGKDAGRRDDLISLFYSLIELSIPKLPWKKISCRRELARIKESYDYSNLIASFPATFLQFFESANGLDVLEKPDYGLLLSILEISLKQCSIITPNSLGVGHDYLSDQSLSSQAIKQLQPVNNASG